MRLSAISTVRVCSLSLMLVATGAVPVSAASGMHTAAPSASAIIALQSEPQKARRSENVSTAVLAYMAPQESAEYDIATRTVVRDTSSSSQLEAVDSDTSAPRPMRLETRDMRTYRPFAFLGSMIRSANSCRNSMGVGANANMGVFLQFRKRC